MKTLSAALFLFVGLAAVVLLATVLAPELCYVGEGQKGNRHGLERRGLGGSGGRRLSVSRKVADNEIRFLRKELAVMKAQRRAVASSTIAARPTKRNKAKVSFISIFRIPFLPICCDGC